MIGCTALASMPRAVFWKKPTGDRRRLTYVSKCGRYTIVKRHFASARNGHFATVGYTFTVVATGKSEKVDTLRDAKDLAEFDNNPNWEP